MIYRGFLLMTVAFPYTIATLHLYRHAMTLKKINHHAVIKAIKSAVQKLAVTLYIRRYNNRRFKIKNCRKDWYQIGNGTSALLG